MILDKVKKYKIGTEVCIQCGKYVPRKDMEVRIDSILGKVMICKDCLKK